MYFLKVKGKSSIPDFIQIRDENYTLIEYFRLEKINEKLFALNLENVNNVIDFINSSPFGIIKKI